MDPLPARRSRLLDGFVATAFVLVSWSLVVGIVDSPRERAFGLALGLAHSGALIVRRSRPVAVMVVMMLTAVLTIPAGLPIVALGPGIVVGLYTLGLRATVERSRLVLVVALCVMAAVVGANNADLGTIVSNGVAFVVAWWLGDRSRRHDLTAAAEKAAARDAAERAALDERLRIARELHDIVAHSMSVIAVQAGAARFAAPAEAGDAVLAFTKIEQMSRSALDEMRRLLTVLRDGEPAGDRTPSPRLEDLPALVAATTDAGIPVQIRTTGTPVPLPEGLELCAFRVVQEALTNVRKHAHAQRAEVRLAFRPEGLDVEILDDGRGPDASSDAGHGIVGMQERVALYGGTFAADRLPDGGFRVAATFPIAVAG